jgi:hypothetical protein
MNQGQIIPTRIFAVTVSLPAWGRSLVPRACPQRSDLRLPATPRNQGRTTRGRVLTIADGGVIPGNRTPCSPTFVFLLGFAIVLMNAVLLAAFRASGRLLARSHQSTSPEQPRKRGNWDGVAAPERILARLQKTVPISLRRSVRRTPNKACGKPRCRAACASRRSWTCPR